MTIRRFTRSTLLAAAFLTSFAAQAQAPAPMPQAVKLVVGYAAGGPVDIAARMVAPFVSRELGTNVIIENKPGANGSIAGEVVARGASDGSTLWFAASPTVTIAPHLMKMSFDPVRDVQPISGVLSYYNVLVINKDLPFKTLGELIEYAKGNPNKVTYGSAGLGSSNHLAGELLAERTHTKMLHVPYRGNAPAMADVLGGQVMMMFDPIGNSRSNIAAGKVRPLAVTSPVRSAIVPKVPTFDEAGVKDADVGGWFAVYAPAKLSPGLAARFTQAFKAALSSPELKARMEEAGLEVWSGSPAEMAQRAERESAIWATVTKGIKIQ